MSVSGLVLPGLDGTGELLKEFIDALGPDLPAKTAAYPTNIPMGYDELTAFVEGLLPQEKTLLIAESFSGPIAIRIASRFPDRFIGLVLCATFVATPRPILGAFRHLLNLPLPIPTNRLIGHITMGRWLTEEWTRRLRIAMRKLKPSVVRHRLAEVMRVDVSAELRHLRVPILYLQASNDRLVPNSAWGHIRSCVPHARMEVVEGPHFLLQAKPERAAATILEFVREH